MADQPAPTNIPSPDPSTVTAPVTTQTTDPNASSQAPALEVKQAAETFDALNKLFDEPASKPVASAPDIVSTTGPTTPPATTEPPKTTPVGADDFQSKLDAAKAPMGAHPNVAAGLASLKELAQAEHAKVEALEAKIKDYNSMAEEYRAMKEGTKLPESIEKEYNALKDWRREVDYRQDPEFQKSYVAPVREAETTILGLLKQAGLSDKVEKFIQDNGGIIALSQSSEPAGQSDNPEMTMAEWVDKKLLAPTPAVFKNRIIGKLSQAQDAIERGQAELQDFRANAQTRWEERNKRMESDFNAGRDEAIAEMGDLAKLKDIPSDAPADVRVALQAHNDRIRKAAAQYDALLKAEKDPKTAGKTMARAIYADVVQGLYLESQAEVKDLRAKLEGIKASGNHTVAGNNSPPIGTEKPTNSDLLKQTTESAMDGLFKATPQLQ